MIAIRIEGPDATALAAEADGFLREALQETPERAVAPPETTPTRTDPMAVASLILSVPGAVLATLDLAQRLKMAERLDRFLATLRARAGRNDRVQLRGRWRAAARPHPRRSRRGDGRPEHGGRKAGEPIASVAEALPGARRIAVALSIAPEDRAIVAPALATRDGSGCQSPELSTVPSAAFRSLRSIHASRIIAMTSDQHSRAEERRNDNAEAG